MVKKQKNWFRRHWILSSILGFFLLIIILGMFSSDSSSNTQNNIANYFNGTIDDVRFYGRDLSSAQMLTIYNSGNGTEDNEDVGAGSFLYEMTADGTNFETVTSGTAHTFSNTGTDLRWRATENSSSAGAIGEVTITNYH